MIHTDDILKGLSRDERYGRYDPDIAPDAEIIDAALHYLSRLANEIGFNGMFEIATFDFFTTARARILTMLIEDNESPLGILERQRDKLLVNAEMTRGNEGIQGIMFALEFTLTPEAAEWFAQRKLTVGELFNLSPGTLLPN